PLTPALSHPMGEGVPLCGTGEGDGGVHLADSSVPSGIAGFTEAILTGQETRVETRGCVDEHLDSGGR
ncbi:MAG TPA: hypothetical protein PK640_09870, partial [Verrucomicrobiota bacterium]|nr:hypothetical protein [Verrucomicrobiota bacterium]